MALVAPHKRQTFDNGTEGANIDGTSSATSGDALAAPTINNAGTVVFAAAAAVRGEKGFRAQGGTADVATNRLVAAADTSAALGRVYFWADAAKRPGTAAQVICRWRNASGNATSIVMSTAGVVIVQNSAGTGIKNLHSNTALPDGAYRIDHGVKKGTGTGDGTIWARIQQADGTAVSDGTYSATNVNAGTADLHEFQTGKPINGGSFDILGDDMAARWDAALAAGDYLNVPPTCSLSAGITTLEAGTTRTVTMTATDPDGSITARSLTQTAGPTVTFIPAGTGVWTYQVPALSASTNISYYGEATDDDGQTTQSATITDTVLPHDNWSWTAAGALVPILIIPIVP